MKSRAFTLVEILVVATIISLLAGAGLISYSQFLKKSRDEKRKADLNTIRSALEMYKSDNDTYPASLNVLTSSSPKYLESIPRDPQGYSYVYIPFPNSCDGNSSICTDYTLYAYLETGGSCSTSQSCGSITCNYCIGPYGEKNN